MRITIKEETFGSTLNALKAVRNEIAARYAHPLILYGVYDPWGEHVQLYGVLLFDKETHEAIIIGPSFRGDSAGEGGAGHRSLLALLGLWGIHLFFHPEPLDHDSWRTEDCWANLILEEDLFQVRGQIPKNSQPEYYREIFR